MRCALITAIALAALASSATGALTANGLHSDASAANLTDVFTREEIHYCAMIRIPALVMTPNYAIVIGQCRHLAPGALPDEHIGDVSETELTDDLTHTVLVQKRMAHGSGTWSDFKVITLPGNGSHGVVYDPKHSRLVLHYASSSSPSQNVDVAYWQQTSDAEGEHWSAPRSISHYLDVCNRDGRDKMTVLSAGNKLVTGTGRLLFAGWGGTGGQCAWWSDNGGDSWSATVMGEGNEVSLAEGKNATVIYANSRGGPFLPHRSTRASTDGGATWGEWKKMSALLDNGHVGCEASLIHLPRHDLFFFSNPTGSDRTNLRVRYAHKYDAEEWQDLTHDLPSGGPRGVADFCGYSYMQQQSATHILLVMEVSNGVAGCTFSSLSIRMPGA